MVTHVEDADAGIERGVVFHIACYINLGPASFGFGKERCSRSRAVGGAGYFFGYVPDYDSRIQADDGAEAAHEPVKAHGPGQIAREAETRARARGIEEGRVHELEKTGQPACRAIGLHIEGGVGSIERHIGLHEQRQRFVIIAGPVGQSGFQSQRMMRENEIGALIEGFFHGFRRGVEGNADSRGFGFRGIDLEAGAIPVRCPGEGCHFFDAGYDVTDAHGWSLIQKSARPGRSQGRALNSHSPAPEHRSSACRYGEREELSKGRPRVLSDTAPR